ncbi:MAG: hypothetical protein U1E05_19155, partial [Patescibacteria group bacterium]|nr:hypothetical protein [Patescibacteria group bacterium]
TEPSHTEPSHTEPRIPLENPEWSRLSRQLAQMEQHHSELLNNRTADHPQVREIAYEIGEVRRALHETPQWLDSDGEAASPPAGRNVASRPVPAPESPADSRSAASGHAEARQQYDRLERQVEEARDRYEQLAAEERAAWAAHVRQSHAEPSLPSPSAVPSGVVASANAAGDNALTTALLAGMAMMVGVGMFAAGASMEPTVNSVEQVASSLAMPVLATVTLPGLRPTASGYHRAWLRLASCLGGVVLMIGCLGLVYRAITG